VASTPTFDPVTFERALEEKVRENPELGAPLTAALLLMLLVAIMGVGLLVQAWSHRKSAPVPPGPPETPRWGIPEAVALIVALPFLSAVALGFAVALGLEAGSIQGMLAASVAGSLLTVGLAFTIAAWRGQSPGRALGFVHTPEGAPPAPLVGLHMLVMAFPIYHGANLLARMLFEKAGWERSINPAAEIFLTTDSAGELAAIIFVAVISAPLLEETIFRGFLFGAVRRRFGARAGAIVSALVFAVVHPVTDWFGIFFLGIALALAYDRAGSLWAAIAAHAINNAWGIAILAAQRYVHKS
jgi:uncharacterized protein